MSLKKESKRLDEFRKWKKKVAAETNRMSKSKLVRYFNQPSPLPQGKKAA